MKSAQSPIRAPKRGSAPNITGSVLLAFSAFGASSQSTQLQQQLGELQCYYSIPASGVRDRRRGRFRSLVRQWREETQWLSSTTAIAMHPAYQSIIGMGSEALPMILADLRKNSGHWYWALKAISNEDPVPPANRGSIRQMKEAWLQWAEQKGITTDDDFELVDDITSPFPVFE